MDVFGQESIASLPQAIVLGGASNAIQLVGIPETTGEFVARRIYRSDDGGPFRLVADLDRSAEIYVDKLAAPADNAATVDPTFGFLNRSRPDASLIVDPGTIIKSDTARIELGFGATLIAEGTEGRDIVFTSAIDNRYGAGGPFDTFQDLSLADSPAAGDWGGIYADRTSRLSLDQVVVAYGGGVTGIGGSTAGFNAVEIHQAERESPTAALKTTPPESVDKTRSTVKAVSPIALQRSTSLVPSPSSSTTYSLAEVARQSVSMSMQWNRSQAKILGHSAERLTCDRSHQAT